MASRETKTKFGEFVNDVNWFKVGIAIVIIVAATLVIKKVFGKDGWLQTGINYIGEGAEWVGDKIETQWNTSKKLMEAGWDKAGQMYDETKKAIEDAWNDYWDD